jgi:NADH-quinone oxidoreductase subunit N
MNGPAKAPHIDWLAISPLIALTVGVCIVLLFGLIRGRVARQTLVPLLTLVTLGTAAGLGIAAWGDNVSVVSDALRMDDLTLALMFMFCVAAAVCVLLSWRALAPREAGHGEYHALLLTTVLGMVVLAGASNLVTLFVGFELLSIPLYVLCATEMRRATSLESGLKYLIVGSVGSATLLYGLAFVYGATGKTNFDAIAVAMSGVHTDPLLLTGIALVVAGLAFKASVAPSTSGRPTSTRAPPPRSRRSWRWRPRPRRSGSCCGSSTSR